MADDLVGQMFCDNWKPDYIVGITRGGLTPALMLSHKTGILMHTLDIRLRDTGSKYGGPESNCWMSEDAYGYEDTKTLVSYRKNILIVDDINDTGETINWIKDDWQASCVPNNPVWNSIWHQNVKFAMLFENEASKVSSDYHCKKVNKFEKDVWIVYPWERQYD